MKNKKALFTIIGLQFLLLNTIFAQQANPDFMQSIGKIYVVVAVILTIFIGIIIYLVTLDKKIKRLEDQINN